jgi:hypothetical protein
MGSLETCNVDEAEHELVGFTSNHQVCSSMAVDHRNGRVVYCMQCISMFDSQQI